ncbi:Fic family protein [Flavobacterium sp. SUN046]|uniref:Fic family protein n=1 Tax=Flavobacterium sp. SUN046 TaxID=3002440 RepID=UPI002DB90A9E|nr:Fic family protein [Flavobacterium sp. SUN046]MEC4050618.1 Fic family protein [Flavobacterium sp. SUN046]
MYIHQRKDWPQFSWDPDVITPILGEVRYKQGKILGVMQSFGFQLQEETSLKTLTVDIIKSSEIEGKLLNHDQVRSSIARRLGIEIAGAVASDREVDGVVDMLLDAIQHYIEPLSDERLFGWHNALFPTGRSGVYKIKTGTWRDDAMQITSGPIGKEIIHFEAPKASKITNEITIFLDWFNSNQNTDLVLKAAIAHLWFISIHPFEDGNGRITRALTDLLLARADQSKLRFYSISSQIQKERNKYYSILESTQKGDLDITDWLRWFLECLLSSMTQTDETIAMTLKRVHFWETHKAIDFNQRQQKILQLLFDDFYGKLNVSKYAKICKVSTDTALRDLQDLLAKGIIEQEGNGRSTSYRLC